MTGYYLVGAIITAAAFIVLVWQALTPTGRHRAPHTPDARADWLEVDE